MVPLRLMSATTMLKGQSKVVEGGVTLVGLMIKLGMIHHLLALRMLIPASMLTGL